MSKADEERSRRIPELVGRVDDIVDDEARSWAQELMQCVLEMHGAGLERMMEVIFDSGSPGQAIIRRFANDGLVASLLVLHGLHPDDMEVRVQHALAKLRGRTHLIGVSDGIVHVRCESAKADVEAALREAAPDAVEIIVEEVAHVNGFVPLSSVMMSATRDS
jgi:hypothetical protein